MFSTHNWSLRPVCYLEDLFVASKWTDALAECLADGQRDGSVRADVPVTELARTVLALWEGAVLSAKLERGPQPLKIARRTL